MPSMPDLGRAEAPAMPVRFLDSPTLDLSAALRPLGSLHVSHHSDTGQPVALTEAPTAVGTATVRPAATSAFGDGVLAALDYAEAGRAEALLEAFRHGVRFARQHPDVPSSVAEAAADVPAEFAEELHPWWCQAPDAVGCGAHDSKISWTMASGEDPKAPSQEGFRFPAVGVSAHMTSGGKKGLSIYMAGADGTDDFIDVVVTPAEAEELMEAIFKTVQVVAGDPKMATRPARPEGGAR